MKTYQAKYSASFVIPVFNEQGSLEELYTQIVDTCKKNNQLKNFEIIFVDDGSIDQTLEILKSLRKEDQRVKIISFRTNMGKAVALSAGFKKASGQFVITMDGDLQDGPENIPAMLEKLDEQYDMVIGWKKRRHDPISKKLPSKIFNMLVRSLFGFHLHDLNSGFKVMKLEVAKELYLYGQMHRFVPILAMQRGFKVTEIEVTHHPRKYGKSKYKFFGRLKGNLDLLTVLFLDVFGQRPLHLFGLLGFIAIFIGIFIGLYLTVLHFQGYSISRRPLLNLAVLLIIAGLQMLLSGFIAEMIVSRRAASDESLPIRYET